MLVELNSILVTLIKFCYHPSLNAWSNQD